MLYCPRSVLIDWSLWTSTKGRSTVTDCLRHATMLMLHRNYNNNAKHTQCRRLEISFGGIAQKVWGRKSPSGYGPIPSRGSGPPEAEAVCRHCFQILSAEMIKIWKFCSIHPDSRPVCFTRWGAKWHIWGISPPAHVAPALQIRDFNT